MGEARPEPRAGFLRQSRRSAEIVLGVDGRPVPQENPFSGLEQGTVEEVAEAAALVDEARRRADEIVRRALHEAARIEGEAHAEGHATGLERGISEGRAELAQALALVQRAAAGMKAAHDDLLRHAEPEIVELVITAVTQVIGESITMTHGLAAMTVRRALARVGSLNVVRVQVHPDDLDETRATLIEQHGDPLPFEVAGNGTVGIGGCIVDTEAGRVDARLDVQMAEVIGALRAAIPEAA